MRSTEALNSETRAALLGFNHEAVLYCQGISDAEAHEYAMDYARTLQSRAKGLEFEKRPSQPSRNISPISTTV
jgi:hypothetical protein